MARRRWRLRPEVTLLATEAMMARRSKRYGIPSEYRESPRWIPLCNDDVGYCLDAGEHLLVQTGYLPCSHTSPSPHGPSMSTSAPDKIMSLTKRLAKGAKTRYAPYGHTGANTAVGQMNRKSAMETHEICQLKECTLRLVDPKDSLEVGVQDIKELGCRAKSICKVSSAMRGRRTYTVCKAPSEEQRRH